jgi:DNA modification methylase
MWAQLALDWTVKHVRLVSRTIMDCSARGDIVLGRGTTVIAAERTERRRYGLIDPMFVDIVV